MPANQLDFKGLASELLSRSHDLVSTWLPGGRVRGREYVTSGLNGGNGDSMSVNLSTGKWADFGDADCKGGDLISLFAAIMGVSQGDAYRRLLTDQGYEPAERPELPPAPAPEPEVCEPPADAPECDFKHQSYGEPTSYWPYMTAENGLMFYVARYDLPDGKKQILPWAWSVNGGWINKGWSVPRPLYGLEILAQSPKALVCIVEGEKAADAARTLLGQRYVVLTWPNGSNAYKKVDWQPVYGRHILLWPDRDQVGIDAMRGIAEKLKKHCPQIKILTPTGEMDGFDAADAWEEGWTTEQTIAWAKSCVSTFHDSAIVLVPKEEIKAQLIAKNVNVEGDAQIIAQNVYTNEEEPGELSQTAEYWKDKLGLAVNKSGTPEIHLNSAIRALTAYPEWKDFVWFDEFQQKIFTTWKLTGEQKFREWLDEDTLEIQDFMISTFGMKKMSKDVLYDALAVVSKRRKKNGPREYFELLEWDEVPRIDNFLSDYMMADHSEYCSAASKNFWIAMVARIYKPGCKVDNMLMLEGGQGKYKSTALNVIGGDWYTEAHGQVTDSNFYYNMQGKLIVEFADLDGISKAEANAIKKFITCKIDRYRAVWARSACDFPRQCVFVGTTNEEEYLKDNTGARRFWPVKTHKIDLQRIKDDRDQLWAEAVARYKAGESWWEMPESAKDEQERRRMSDEWEVLIDNYLKGKSETSIIEIACDALKMEASRVDRPVQSRIGKALRFLNWECFRVMDDGSRRYVWRNKKYYAEVEF